MTIYVVVRKNVEMPTEDRGVLGGWFYSLLEAEHFQDNWEECMKLGCRNDDVYVEILEHTEN